MGGPRGKASFYTVVGLLCLYSIAAANTHWANINGTNIPPYCSYATGSHRIQDAVDVAVAGDTVRVAAGQYDLDTTIILWDSLALVGAGMDSSFLVWYASVAWIMLQAEGYTCIKGLDFSGNGYALGGIKFFNSKQPVEIGNCRTHECEYDVSAHWVSLDMHDCELISYMNGVDLGPYLLKSIHHNTFYGNGKHHAIFCWVESDIYDNVFHSAYPEPDLWGEAIESEYDYGDHLIHNNLFLEGGCAVRIYESTTTRVYNNTIIGTQYVGGPLLTIIDDYSRVAWIYNNIFYECTGSFYVDGNPDEQSIYHFQYNMIWPRPNPLFDFKGWILFDTIGNIYADPMLSSDSNFYLQAGSPAIDAGDPTILDIDGTRSDIGMYGGPGGSSYGYPEEAPKRPDTLMVETADEVVILSWSRNGEADLAEYRLYRDSTAGFPPVADHLRANINPADTMYTDVIDDPNRALYYLLTAVDTAGLESPPSNEVSTFSTGILEGEESSTNLPRTPYIIGNYPNPFNSSTTIEYYLPDIGARPTAVQLSIYNALGRKAATIVDERQNPGHHCASWDGRTDSGACAASGVYFAKLTIWGHEFASSAKLVLQK